MQYFLYVPLSNFVTKISSSANLGQVPRQGQEGRARPGWAGLSAAVISSAGPGPQDPGVEAELHYDMTHSGQGGESRGKRQRQLLIFRIENNSFVNMKGVTAPHHPTTLGLLEVIKMSIYKST